MDPAIRENGNSESGALPEPPMDMLGVSPSQTEVFMSGNAPWPISRQGQNTIMVGCAPNRAQMWESLFYVWITLQSTPGEALYPLGR